MLRIVKEWPANLGRCDPFVDLLRKFEYALANNQNCNL